jgi:hypothetical protein
MVPTPNTTINDLVSQLADADPNDLALAYMALVETGTQGVNPFLEAAEKRLTEQFAELKEPVLDRLRQDLITQPIFPGRPPSNPLTRIVEVWGRKGALYRSWKDYQSKWGFQREFQMPTSGPRGSEWQAVPPEFSARRSAANAPSAGVTTPQQRAQIAEYNQRYRHFHNLPDSAPVEFDPDLDFKIRVVMSQKMAGAGPLGSVFGIAALLQGGSPEDVMSAIDLGTAVDGMNPGAGYGTAADGVNSAINGGFQYPLAETRPLEPGQRGTMPLAPPFMRRGYYSRQLPPAKRPVYSHRVHKGGLEDIMTNQRMMATYARGVAGGTSAVRAWPGPAGKGDGRYPFIEFTTDLTPNRRNFMMGGEGVEWPMPEGEYLQIQLQKVVHPNGTFETFKGPPPEKQPPSPPPVNLVLPPASPPKPPPPTPAPSATPPVVAGAPRPQPDPTPVKQGRRFTMREWMVANVLTKDWQVVSGIYLLTGISDNDLATILNMLVDEGYAEKTADSQRPGWFMYRGSAQWLAFKDK